MAKRKPAPEKRRHSGSVRIRLVPEHEADIRHAAQLAGLNLSAWVRERLIKSARQELVQAGLTPKSMERPSRNND
jgi:predicted HicB family RNase H-like nuclease